VQSRHTKFAHLSPTRRWTILLCLLLVGAAFAANAFHLHPNDLSDAKHCTVCQVAHAPFQVVSLTQILLGLTATAFFTVSAQPSSKTFLTAFSLFSRPPPLV
jgi:hypothetical protein